MGPIGCFVYSVIVLLCCCPEFVCGSPFALSNLQDDRLSKGYKARLLQAGKMFATFCESQGFVLQHVLHNSPIANTALIAFIQFTYDSRRPIWVGTHAILALQTANRHMKGLLRPAWDSIQSWKLSTPVCSRVPMPESVLKAFCYFAVMQGLQFDTSNSYMWLVFSICLRLGFYALLRPKELLQLTKGCLKLPLGRLLNSSAVAVATIRDPKNRAFMGRLQVRMIRDPAAIEWLSWYAPCLPPSALLWPFSEHSFRTCLADCCKFFDVAHLGLTPASLRAGGATLMLEQGQPLSTIRFAGSWASDKAMACYLQEAESASVLLSLNRSQLFRFEKALADFRQLEHPPNIPFAVLSHGSRARSKIV